MKKYLDNENGAVLITGLMILLILTLIGITAMQSSTLEEVMSRNQVSRNIAFEAAEAALREAEDFLNAASLPAFPGTNATPSATGLYQPEVDIDSLDWDATDSTQYGGTAPAGAVAAPRYIIEDLGIVEMDDPFSLVPGVVIERNMYRVSAYGVGATATSVVILQTTFANYTE